MIGTKVKKSVPSLSIIPRKVNEYKSSYKGYLILNN